MTDLTLAVISMTTTADKPRNVDRAFALVREAKARGADWVQLPEMWAFMGSYDQVYDMAETEDGPLLTRLSELAKDLKIVLFAGTIGERPDRDVLAIDAKINALGQRRVFNTAYVFDRSGSTLAKYRKTHLFNLVRDDGPSYRESDGFIPGDQLVSFDVDGLSVALSVCYDLRFPELYSRLAREREPDVIAVPSAFTQSTGQAHWELLLRARAVERQAYVYAANQVGTHGPGKQSFGHSMIVDPWGVVLADTGDQPGIALASIQPRRIAEVRAKLPALANRRPVLY